MRVRALIKRIIQQVLRDKRTLMLMMGAPLLIMTLLYFLFTSNNSSDIKIGVYNTTTTINEELKNNDVDVVVYKDNDNINNKIKDDKLVAFISSKDDKITITYENSNPADAAKAKIVSANSITKEQMTNISDKLKEIVKSASAINPNIAKNNSTSKISIESKYVYGDENLTYFDTVLPVLIGFFVFFFVFLISGMALLKERTTKTLEKLLASPIKRGEIVMGYLCSYGLFAIIQTIIIVLFAVNVLGIKVAGSIYLVMLVSLIIAFIALTFGLLLSTFANSEFQMFQFIPLAVVPQVFFAGLVSVDKMDKWLQTIAHFMPLYYGGDALRNIIIKGYGFNDIKFDLMILLLFVVVFTILNIVGLKRYRKI